MAASSSGPPAPAYADRLLAYLNQQGFASVVAEVKDIRSDGVVLVPLGRQHFTDEQVAEFGRLLRAFHDAGAGFEGMSAGSVALKGDPGPMTTALVDGRPAILIGLHRAGAGEAVDEVATSCWHWALNPAASQDSVPTQAHQLRVLADAYGVSTRRPPGPDRRDPLRAEPRGRAGRHRTQ